MSTPSTGPPITKIVLERIGGGPRAKWQKLYIVLRRSDSADAWEATTFDHLARWLETSSFFSRQSGYVPPARLFPLDVGHLMIQVTRGGRASQVWSYNGARDDELWETEMVIRGTQATLTRHRAEIAYFDQWNRQHPVMEPDFR